MRAPLQLAIAKARAARVRNQYRTKPSSRAAGAKKPRKFRQQDDTIAKELYRKLPIEIEAILLASPTTVETLEGKMSGDAGDWLVTGVAGEQYIVAHAIFAETFEPTDAASKELWAHAYPTGTEGLVAPPAPAPAEKAEPDPLDVAAAGAPSPPDPSAAPPSTPTQRSFRGIPIQIDRPRGHVMTGVDTSGRPWRRVYHVDYGFVPGTKGGDGQGLDVFLGGDETALEAHWILQRKADGSFDEYKCMLGFQDAKSAKLMYEMHVPRQYFGSMCSMGIEMMKALLGIEPIDSIGKMLDGVRGMLESHGGYPRAAEIAAAAQHPAPSAEKQVRLAKADEIGGELRYTLGIVLEPEVVDAQGDVYSADEIRKSAWEYMANFRNVGLMHKGLVNGKVRLVESFIAPCDMTLDGSTIHKGAWMMGLHVVDDEIWAKIKSGGLTGLSIGGFARRQPVTP